MITCLRCGAAALRARLRRLASEEISVYHDTYYDRPGRDLTAQGRELRVASWTPAACAVEDVPGGCRDIRVVCRWQTPRRAGAVPAWLGLRAGGSVAWWFVRSG